MRPFPLYAGCCDGPTTNSSPGADNVVGILIVVGVVIVVAGNIWWWGWGRKLRRSQDGPPTQEGR